MQKLWLLGIPVVLAGEVVVSPPILLAVKAADPQLILSTWFLLALVGLALNGVFAWLAGVLR